MNTRLYVGNLSFNTTADGVRTAFQEFGTVSDVHLVTDRETGRSRGFAFVTMVSPEAATKAIEGMDGHTLDGRPVRVDDSEQRPARGGVGGAAVVVEIEAEGAAATGAGAVATAVGAAGMVAVAARVVVAAATAAAAVAIAPTAVAAAVAAVAVVVVVAVVIAAAIAGNR